jgi:hypothetical protein
LGQCSAVLVLVLVLVLVEELAESTGEARREDGGVRLVVVALVEATCSTSEHEHMQSKEMIELLTNIHNDDS